MALGRLLPAQPHGEERALAGAPRSWLPEGSRGEISSSSGLMSAGAPDPPGQEHDVGYNGPLERCLVSHIMTEGGSLASGGAEHPGRYPRALDLVHTKMNALF